MMRVKQYELERRGKSERESDGVKGRAKKKESERNWERRKVPPYLF